MAGEEELFRILRRGTPPRQIDEASIGDLEQEALKAANSVYSALGEALAEWDALPEKPPQLREKAARYRMLAESLSAWVRKMLLSMRKRREFGERVKLLEDFADIFMSYGGV